jgi:phospholipase/lecithinase/hemolysin
MSLATRLKGAAGCALAALSLASPAWAEFSKVVVFSDSMSDTHRYADFTEALTGTRYPAPPAYGGRFCNGPVAVEVLADALHAPLQGYSFSGAKTDYGTLLMIPLGVLTQVNEYLNDNTFVPTIKTVPVLSDVLNVLAGPGIADPKALHVIWSGPDDYYALGGMNSLTAYFATANIQQAITALYKGGARYFFVPTMPDLGITPSARQHEVNTPGYIASASRYSAQFTKVLTTGLAAMRQKYPDAHIMSYDTLTLLKTEMDKGKAQGKNVVDACYPGGLLPQSTPRVACPDPDNHLFWDDNHPTAYANRILGSAWAASITERP